MKKRNGLLKIIRSNIQWPLIKTQQTKNISGNLLESVINMDSNKYRRGTGIKYNGMALTIMESKEFFAKYNKPGERYCIKCGHKFISAGALNRKCPACSNKEESLVKTNTLIMPAVYRIHLSGARATKYHAESGE